MNNSLQFTINLNKANDMVHQANMLMYYVWKNYMLFTWRWWIGVFLTIAPWILWFFIRKKESTDRLLYSGFVFIIISMFLDIIGMAMGLWAYPSQVIPIIPPFIPWDITLLPVTAMLFMQFKPKSDPIIKSIIFSSLASFIVEPLFTLLNIYDPKNWHYFYSFPIYIAIYLISYGILKRNKFEML